MIWTVLVRKFILIKLLKYAGLQFLFFALNTTLFAAIGHLVFCFSKKKNAKKKGHRTTNKKAKSAPGSQAKIQSCIYDGKLAKQKGSKFGKTTMEDQKRQSAERENEKKKKKDKTMGKTKKQDKKDQPSSEYPGFQEPTRSAKQRKQVALEKSKMEKIRKGFYQSHSDEDDTLDQVGSLEEENSDESSSQ
ncbi:hypothetical protein L596_008043 [Steinernema carpocapsae]|uniref:Uncharacterized protein n=1 Tax=Steinernema carpocapsae TaxID=34508 RepID=A0A4U5PB93_STECR|nr:hypothetical protein L596_008043 [Steinernema carpocapsae]